MELRRGDQVKPPLHPQGVDVGVDAGTGHQRGGFDFDEAAMGEEGAQRVQETVPDAEPLPQTEGGKGAGNGVYFLTRPTYDPVRVSMVIFSPCSMKRGTYTSAPVESLTFLVAPVAVSPFTPGSE